MSEFEYESTFKEFEVKRRRSPIQRAEDDDIEEDGVEFDEC